MEKNEMVLLTTEQIKKELDVSKKFIQEMKKQAESLVIVDIDDKDGYENVKNAIATLRDKRTSVKSLGEELKRPALDYQRNIIKIVKELTEELQPIEDGLKEKRKVIDDEKEKIREEKRKEKERIFTERSAKLHNLPQVQFNGKVYFLGNESVNIIDIGGLDDKEFEEKYLVLKSASDQLEKERIEKEEADRKAKEEADRVAKDNAAKLAEAEAKLKEAEEKLAEREKILDVPDELGQKPVASDDAYDGKKVDGIEDEPKMTEGVIGTDPILKTFEISFAYNETETGSRVTILASELRRLLTNSEIDDLKFVL